MGRKAKTRQDRYGAWLRHLREQSGLSQQELARKLRVPQSTLSYWERTGMLAGRRVIMEMSSVFGVSFKELLSGRSE